MTSSLWGVWGDVTNHLVRLSLAFFVYSAHCVEPGTRISKRRPSNIPYRCNGELRFRTARD